MADKRFRDDGGKVVAEATHPQGLCPPRAARSDAKGSPEPMEDLLRATGLEHYIPKFHEHEIDMTVSSTQLPRNKTNNTKWRDPRSHFASRS